MRGETEAIEPFTIVPTGVSKAIACSVTELDRNALLLFKYRTAQIEIGEASKCRGRYVTILEFDCDRFALALHEKPLRTR